MIGIETYLAGSPLLAIAAAFAGGILVSLSPCVYPMIPVISAYVGSRSIGENSRMQSFLLSSAYVAGMASVYALLGMIAALTGSFFGQISTSPWAFLFVASIFLLLGLNMLGWLPFPSWLSQRPIDPSSKGLVGAFLLGATSGLVASPCTSPVLFGLLTYVATKQSLVYGGSLLFAFSLGMGILLIFVGTFAGMAMAMPRPGKWMVGVKRTMGLLMLGLVVYYLFQARSVWQ